MTYHYEMLDQPIEEHFNTCFLHSVSHLRGAISGTFESDEELKVASLSTMKYHPKTVHAYEDGRILAMFAGEIKDNRFVHLYAIYNTNSQGSKSFLFHRDFWKATEDWCKSVGLTGITVPVIDGSTQANMLTTDAIYGSSYTINASEKQEGRQVLVIDF